MLEMSGISYTRRVLGIPGMYKTGMGPSQISDGHAVQLFVYIFFLAI